MFSVERWMYLDMGEFKKKQFLMYNFNKMLMLCQWLLSIFVHWLPVSCPFSIVSSVGAKLFKKTLASRLTFQEKQVAVDPICPSFWWFREGVTCAGPWVDVFVVIQSAHTVHKRVSSASVWQISLSKDRRKEEYYSGNAGQADSSEETSHAQTHTLVDKYTCISGTLIFDGKMHESCCFPLP